ncbi:hypothetical protein ABZZ17_13345 [Streptomyces sp. NPDC006512]|uniref:hypothetical protein n=1 Tax=Streptomyces sp. NPDC006512 TaxID=3154307 RepID=UPI0033AF8786
MVTYENVLNAPLDRLQTAAGDWQAMAGKLGELAEAARNGMKAKSDKAEWSGVTAGVARPFVNKTAKEFEDAAKAAKGVHQALTQAHAAFKASRDRLKRLSEVEVPAAGFRVDGKGKVHAAPLTTDAERNAARHDPDYQEALRVNLPRWQAMIDAAVDACDDTDRSLARLLGANVSADHDFTAPKYAGLSAEQAGHAVALASRGRRLSHTELVELNELLADNAKVPEFATRFYAGLGPKGALEFFGHMATDTHDWGRLDEQRLKDVQELQKNLGFNLATATSSTTEPHLPDSYAQELRRLGTQHVPLAKYDQNPPYGYQLLGGIMRYGNYDPKFLVPIAEHATQIHAKDPDFFNGTRQLNTLGKNLLNPSGTNGAGYDPVVSFLEALGHSPDAAKVFFDPERPPQAYHQDGTAKPGPADLGKGADKQPVKSYLDFFAHEKYDFTIDMEGRDPAELDKIRQYMPDALGHALEAATLGHAWDDPSPKLERDDTSARIMKEVALKYGGDAGLLNSHEALADSLGTMTAGYVDDVNQALAGNDPRSPFAPKNGEDGHMELERGEARKLLSALGQHPDAYATVSTAERVYTTSVLEAQVGPDGRVDRGAAREAARVGAEVQGMLDQSRANQVTEHQVKRDEAYDKALKERGAWIEFGAGATVAAGVAFLPATAAVGAAAILVPLAVETGGGALEKMAGQVVGDWSEAAQKQHEDDEEKRLRQQVNAIFRSGQDMMLGPSQLFIESHRIRGSDSEFAESMVEAALIGYGVGSDREVQHGHDPE